MIEKRWTEYGVKEEESLVQGGRRRRGGMQLARSEEYLT
ncbi:hypothetical protein E2C01_061714 [Portunus trituberculatus]|uniref:Uncharacterized protein n=1 Tax=Portunus trituberculatus TaxID=210409 RepID=A0A5B7HE06_PORTR|nr:hypothetical protein [Portunus trituberculatus]